MITLPEPIPAGIAALPRDERGYPIPWFVAELEGQRDFRIADQQKLVRAINSNLCWVCGERLGRYRSFVIGPMCSINRLSAEPPSHKECAIFSCKVCPFLSMPKAQRPERPVPEGVILPPGEMITRNPGVTLVWTVGPHGYVVEVHNRGPLFRLLDEPVSTDWFCEGRQATRAEVLASIESGIPYLRELAGRDGPEAILELAKCVGISRKYLPPPGPGETDA